MKDDTLCIQNDAPAGTWDAVVSKDYWSVPPNIDLSLIRGGCDLMLSYFIMLRRLRAAAAFYRCFHDFSFGKYCLMPNDMGRPCGTGPCHQHVMTMFFIAEHWR